MVVGVILVTGASVAVSLLVMQVAVLPLMFRYSKTLQRKIVFSNFINYPRNLNYERPSTSNIIGGKNFQIEFQSKTDNCPIKIGAWHLQPVSVFRSVAKETTPACAEAWRDLKTTSNTVVLYCHGNSNHRGSPHRLQLYRMFQELNFHVVTFDYRGYGDSTNTRPTEAGVVEDLLEVYAWLMRTVSRDNKPTVVLWGHSLGSAVASNLVAHLPQLCAEYKMPQLPPPDALVLEAPFNNLYEEIECHPLSKCVSWLPYYRYAFLKPFSTSKEYSFTTDQYLANVKDVPILMLHCKGDRVVPYELAVKLYEYLYANRSEDTLLIFHTFDKGNGLGHNNLCCAADMKNVVLNFLSLIKKQETSLFPEKVQENEKIFTSQK